MEEKKLYNAVRKIITLADGRQIEIETGKLAKQADGSPKDLVEEFRELCKEMEISQASVFKKFIADFVEKYR